MAFQKFFSKFWTLNVGEKKSFHGGSLLQSIHPPEKKDYYVLASFPRRKTTMGKKCYTTPIQTKIKMTTVTNLAIIIVQDCAFVCKVYKTLIWFVASFLPSMGENSDFCAALESSCCFSHFRFKVDALSRR